MGGKVCPKGCFSIREQADVSFKELLHKLRDDLKSNSIFFNSVQLNNSIFPHNQTVFEKISNIVRILCFDFPALYTNFPHDKRSKDVIVFMDFYFNVCAHSFLAKTL